MADRVAHVIWAKAEAPRRFGVGLAVFVAAVVLLASGLSTASPATSTNRASAVAADQQGIAGKVNSLISRMTVAEKFGQLEMAGPDGPNGSPGSLLALATAGQIGSVLDLVGVSNINQTQQAALQSRLHIPHLRARRDPRLQDAIPGAAGRSVELGSGVGRGRRGRVR